MPYGLPDINKDLMLFLKSHLLNQQLDFSEMLNSSLTKSKIPIHQTLVPATKETWRQAKPAKSYSTYKLRYFGLMRIFLSSGTTSKCITW